MNSTQSTSASRSANISRQRRFWNERAISWDHGAQNNPGLVKVVERVIAEAAPRAGMTVIDIGCGSGQLSLRVAPLVERVIGIDISQAMIDLLLQNARKANLSNVEGIAIPIEHLQIEDSSVDLVISNYVLHHLRDRDKAVAVATAARWLRPGGRLVIGDMMFGRGTDARDREIISSKVALMIKKGPAGWWRIAKNASRYLLRFQERPVSIAAWVEMFRAAGLHEVVAIPVVNEASVVRGTRIDRDHHVIAQGIPQDQS
ncbi:MAG TPA: class I SAM-dependent methyltransferase [Acidimicrobiales bacterium]|nr:class I SAM-dependent methyltransferase [Acidimicrobiales bacterium]